jgi:hypothetical protein
MPLLPGDRFERVIATGSLSRSTTGSRTALTRITLVGERRRIDLVLPSREPVGILLPEIMRLLDDRVGPRPELRHLVTMDGAALAHDSTLESAGVPDGAVLRLVRAEDAPSAPVVHDISDEVADDLDVRPWRWRPAARRVVAGLSTVVWALAAGVLARGGFALSAVAGGLVAVVGVCAVAGVLCGRGRRHGMATTLIVTATRRAHLTAADEAARACSSCGVFAVRVKGFVQIRPRHLPYSERRLELVWHKRRWYGTDPAGPRRPFTGQVRQVPAGARITTRVRVTAGRRAGRGSTVVQAARDLRLSRPTVMTPSAPPDRKGLRRLSNRWRSTRPGRAPSTWRAGPGRAPSDAPHGRRGRPATRSATARCGTR